ncbi:hypothetical protein Pfo_014755 [Paulownia fortunei]|nr:hypothetical protein Pfo_014755 [Paulownia fortunei]
MKTLTILQQITPPQIKQLNPWPQSNRALHHNRRETPFPPPRTWRLHGGAKGFASSPKDRESIARKSNTGRNEKKYTDVDDKIPDLVWERMISRILFYVGGPLAIGFALLQAFSVLKEQELWDVPKWLPFLTTFITFGASALGIAYGSLSTSLDAEEEGSFLGFEQVEKNWVEMWKEEDD